MTRRAQGELLLARKAAVEALMATGATRDEADAMVREEVCHTLRREAQQVLAVYAAAWEEVASVVERAFHALAAALAPPATRHRTPPWQLPAGQRRRDYALVR